MTRLVAAMRTSGIRRPARGPDGSSFESPLSKKSPARKVRVQIDSRYECIDLVQRLAEGLCRVSHFGRPTSQKVGLAVREAVANAIKHGNRLQEKKPVDILFRVEPGKLVVSVKDQGSGFDPQRIKSPLTAENIFQNHGRGIFFMKNFVDDLTFTRLPSGGMEVRMEKRSGRKLSGRAARAGTR
jgi:serine/threonine-protein kinase RsbW